jgi:hypothetical protein
LRPRLSSTHVIAGLDPAIQVPRRIDVGIWITGSRSVAAAR